MRNFLLLVLVFEVVVVSAGMMAERTMNGHLAKSTMPAQEARMGLPVR